MIRLNTIFAVFKRDFIKLNRYPTWIIQLFIWPLIFPLMYILSAIGLAGPGGGGLDAYNKATGTQSYAGYIVIGTMAWMWVNTTMWGFGTCLREDQTLGTLESNWLCPINKFDYLLGSSLISVLQAIVISIISIVEYRFIYGIEFTGNPLSWILMFLIMMPGVYGLGILFASLVLWIKESNAAVQLVRGILMVFCGITFPAYIMPDWMRAVSSVLPFTYGIEAAREVMIMGKGINAAMSNILLCLALGFLFALLGRMAFLFTERRVKELGSLERF